MFFETYDDARTREMIGGKRFSVVYRLCADERTARGMAEDICVEQTVEFPAGLLPPGAIPKHLTGRIERFEKEDISGFQRAAGPLAPGGPPEGDFGFCFEDSEAAPQGGSRYLAVISFADETASGEFTQFLNVVFGNISIKRGIQVARICPDGAVPAFLPGPRCGIGGIRELVGVFGRPLLFTALKPMGLSAADMAALAGQFAEGGVDIVKDDHGLTNQVFAPFEERVALCAAAVRNANAKSGGKTLYVPNVTAPAGQVSARARRAKELGAGGVLIAPGLTGLDAMRELAASNLGLPIFAHPAFIGTYAVNAQGIACDALFGTLMRMAGADAVIFPNYGGRFPLSQSECLGIARAGREKLGSLKPVFPAPAGGMQLENIEEMVRTYGIDMLALVGGGLFAGGGSLAENCRRFLAELEK